MATPKDKIEHAVFEGTFYTRHPDGIMRRPFEGDVYLGCDYKAHTCHRERGLYLRTILVPVEPTTQED